MVAVPQFVTHYHLPDRRPFLNLSDLDGAGADKVLTELDVVAAAGLSQRRFGPSYRNVRKATEALLRQRFMARGGRPTRISPHYFVLGESPWFRGLYADCAEVRVLLQDLPRDATSITWPDSIASMGLLADHGIRTVDRPQYGSVFLLNELQDVVERYGMPDGEAPAHYDGHQRKSFDHFIEVQLWSDEPLRTLML